MTDQPDDQPRSDDQDQPDDHERIEREIRAQRRNSLADALGAADGGSHLRGASPIPLQRRARLELDQWLARNLPDPEGALRVVVLRRIEGQADDPRRTVDAPAATAAAWLEALLALPAAVVDVVREADAEWGRMYGERPRFERGDDPPAADDPYTVACVTRTLERLLAEARRQS